MPHPFASSRELFPILKDKVQLSSCSQSAMALPVRQAIENYLDVWQHKGMDWQGWMTHVESARAQFARLIHARPDDVAIAMSVSDAASTIGSALNIGPDKCKILVGETDFPSLGHVWLAHERKGAKVQYVQADANFCIPTSSYVQQIQDDTLLVNVSHVSYYNGYVQDISEITRAARKHDAIVFVDAYQSAGAVQIDVTRDDIDVLVSGAQKFLLGCPGIAFMYVRPELARRLTPSTTGWFGRTNPFEFNIRHLDFPETGRKFDTGTPPMVNAAAADAALSLLNTWDSGQIEQYLKYLAQLTKAECARWNLKVVTSPDPTRQSATTAVLMADAAAAEKQLAQRGYIVSARNDVIRIAPHLYNTEDEVIAAVRALAAL